MTTVPKRSRLARLRAALRTRDWLGIGIELAVVTVGILLAFQVEQWGQARQRADEERQLLERLHAEYGRAIEEMRDVVGHHDRVMAQFRVAFADRDDPARLRRHSAVLNLGCRAGYLGTAPFSDTVAQELLSSGRLNLISDQRLRGEIRDLTTTQAWLRDRGALGTAATQDAGPYLFRHLRYEILPDGRSTCRVLWPELVADPLAVSAAIRTYRMHELVGRGRRDLLEQTQRVRNRIGCKLGKPDCQA